MRKEFDKAATLEELKAIYKRLAMKHHPDRGGDVETMKEINALYDEYFERLKHVHKNKDGETYTKETNEMPEYFKAIIDKLMKMDGVTVEVIGCFIWVAGNTKPYKDDLKAMKFRWHSTKKCWYKAPDGYKKYGKKKYSMDEIRTMYGTTGIYTGKAEKREELTA